MAQANAASEKAQSYMQYGRQVFNEDYLGQTADAKQNRAKD